MKFDAGVCKHQRACDSINVIWRVMLQPRLWVCNSVEYVAIRSAAATLTAIDPRAAMALMRLGGRIVHALDGHRARAAAQIKQCFPEWSDAQVRRTVVRFYEHLGQLVTEILFTPRFIHCEPFSRRISYSGIAPALRVLCAGKPTILVTGHVGNWEVLGLWLTALGFNVAALARPLENPFLSNWLFGLRERRGQRIITKFDATDQMQAALAEGAALSFVADQDAGAKGVFVPFFGRLASTYKSVALLAMRQNVPILCGCAHRVPHAGGIGFVLNLYDVIEPDHWADVHDPLYYITARYMRAIEEMVRHTPEQYFWTHRRWRSRPQFERDGKSMPASIQQNLETLPWMTPGLMQQLRA